jgi:hypothetical protein
MGVGRILANVIMAVIISLAMLLVITGRNIPEREVAPGFFSMAAHDDPIAVWSIRGSDALGLSQPGPLSEAQPLWSALQDQNAGQPAWAKILFERHPPHWVMTLAVAWDRSQPLTWWWLPLIVLGVRVVIGLLSSRRR